MKRAEGQTLLPPYTLTVYATRTLRKNNSHSTNTCKPLSVILNIYLSLRALSPLSRGAP